MPKSMALSSLIQQEAHKFPRGARPTPRYQLCAATPHRVVGATPAEFTVVPPVLSYWLNNSVGDCVSAETCFSIAWYTVFLGLPEVVIPDNVLRDWCVAHGVLNGADLLSVCQMMQKKGFQVGAQLYNGGAPTSVDYSNESILQNAISQGPIKIGIDANALPNGAGSQQGWYSTGGGNYGNEDHAVSLGGFGPAGYLFDQLKVALPSGLSASTPGYHLFTWSTIGFVTHDWIMGTCAEAWLRTPTVVGVPPLGPPPPPPAPPAPTLVTNLDIPGGMYTVGDSRNPTAMLYVSSSVPTGTYIVNIPTPPAPAPASVGVVTLAEMNAKLDLISQMLATRVGTWGREC